MEEIKNFCNYYTQQQIEQKDKSLFAINNLCYYKEKTAKQHINMLFNIFNNTKTIDKEVVEDKGEKYYMQEEIEKSSNEYLKKIIFPQRKVFYCDRENYKQEALDYVNKQKTCVIKPHNHGDSRGVYIKHIDGSLYSAEDGIFVKKKIDDILNENNYKGANIVVEDNIMTNKDNTYERVPWRFFCGNGKVFCCCISYHNYKVSPFEKRDNCYYGAVFLDETMNEVEYEDKKFKMTDEEKKKFDEICCDKETYQTMWRCAEKLSKDIPSIRIDFFCVKQKDETYKIYMNEFQPVRGSGYVFIEMCGKKYVEKYNEMCHIMNVDDDNLNTFGKIIKHNQRKNYRTIEKPTSFNVIDKKKKMVTESVKTDKAGQKNIMQIDKNSERSFSIFSKKNNKQYTISKEKKIFIKNKDKEQNIKENNISFNFISNKPSDGEGRKKIKLLLKNDRTNNEVNKQKVSFNKNNQNGFFPIVFNNITNSGRIRISANKNKRQANINNNYDKKLKFSHYNDLVRDRNMIKLSKK